MLEMPSFFKKKRCNTTEFFLKQLRRLLLGQIIYRYFKESVDIFSTMSKNPVSGETGRVQTVSSWMTKGNKSFSSMRQNLHNAFTSLCSNCHTGCQFYFLFKGFVLVKKHDLGHGG